MLYKQDEWGCEWPPFVKGVRRPLPAALLTAVPS